MHRLCALLLLFLLTLPAQPCSLCPSIIKRDTLGQEFERAKIVFYGRAVSSKLNLQADALPGSGITEFHIDKVLKHDPILGTSPTLVLERYLPVVNPKDPPRFVFFCDIFKGKLDPYLGRSAVGPDVVAYIEEARTHRAQGRAAALQFYGRHLDHKDPIIADDAFMEFAKSSDQDIGQISARVGVERARQLVKLPRLDADRLSLYAFFLGACGTKDDVPLLLTLLNQADENNRKATDGVLCAVATLDPAKGWDMIQTILTDKRQGFAERFGALRAVRFLHGWKADQVRPDMLRCFASALPDPELADMVVEDLRLWKRWELTDQVLALADLKTHQAPIILRGIVRYALSSPQPPARAFVDRVRRAMPDVVRDAQEILDYEKSLPK